ALKRRSGIFAEPHAGIILLKRRSALCWQIKRDYWGGSARPPQKAANRKIRISSRTRRVHHRPKFLSYMSARDLEQLDKHPKLRCPRILEPSFAGLADAL